MGEGTKKIFLKWLPRLLFMRRPLNESDESLRQGDSSKHNKGKYFLMFKNSDFQFIRLVKKQSFLSS